MSSTSTATIESSSTEYRYAFLHGFASSPQTEKAVHLQEYMKEKFNIEMVCPDLNIPTFEDLTVTNMLNYLKEELFITRDGEKNIKWRVVASSLGGFTACRFAQLYPGIIDSLLLLAPAFDIQGVWQSFITLEKWEKLGAIPVFNYKYNENRNIKSGHLKDLLNHPSFPIPEELMIRNDDQEVNQRIFIIHGSDDTVIPYGNSLKFVQLVQENGFSDKSVEISQVKDGHGLTMEESLQLMEKYISEKWIN